MAFNIQQFRAEFQYGGARKTLYKCLMIFPPFLPGASAAGQKMQFLCKNIQVPESAIGTIDVAYFGRKLTVPGDRTKTELSLTVINDEDFLIRRAFEAWSNMLQSHVGNIRNPIALETNQYQSDLILLHYDKIGTENKVYKFVGVWPSSVGSIDLGYEDTDSISETPITLQYQWWETDVTT